MFKKINYAALEKGEAMQLGAFEVGHHAAATFMIMPSRQEIGQRFRRKGMMQDFYRKQGAGGEMFIERPARRIKSPGEVREISYKGIATQRAKSIWRL